MLSHVSTKLKTGGRELDRSEKGRRSSGAPVLPTLQRQPQPGGHPLPGLRLPQGVRQDEVREALHPHGSAVEVQHRLLLHAGQRSQHQASSHSGLKCLISFWEHSSAVFDVLERILFTPTISLKLFCPQLSYPCVTLNKCLRLKLYNFRHKDY